MKEIQSKFQPKIGIVTALGIEYLAMKALMDDGEEKIVKGIGKCFFGIIRSKESGAHYLLLAEAGMGNNMSALCTEKLRDKCPSIDTFIMVGIAGAVPHLEKPEDDVRLGDIVVVGRQGIVQYDFIKKTEYQIQYRYPPRAPKASYLKAAETLKREEEEGTLPWLDHIEAATGIRGEEWNRPSAATDQLEHPKGNSAIRKKGEPKIFIGTIASGNTLLKDPTIRDRLRNDLSAKAVEMEASGVADASWINEINYFAIRGTCDYCDGNKNDVWQKYAAIISAAYTKALLASIPGTGAENEASNTASLFSDASAERNTMESSNSKNASKRVVITVHGILTNAKWQKSVTPILNVAGLIVEPHDFGRLSLWKFSRRKSRDVEIERFRAAYERVVANKDYGLDPDDPTKRPSAVAHSFGTYIVAQCMRRHHYVRLDKILLCGCILQREFDWSELFARDQANYVLNLCCMKDPWVPRARFLVPDAGDSGVNGFDYWGSLLKTEKKEECSHSDFFTEADIRDEWLSFLSRAPSRYRIVHSKHVESTKELARMLNEAHDIDTEVFKELPHYLEQEVPRGLSLGWSNFNDDIYTFLVDRSLDRTVGYINAMPVSEECFDAILAGSKADNEITQDDVVSYEPNSTMSLYLMSIAVAPSLQKRTTGLHSEELERLRNGLIGKLMHYALNQSVRIRRMSAVGWTPQGRRLCAGLRMKSDRCDKYGNPVFSINLEDPSQTAVPMNHPGWRRLLEVYDSLKSR